MQLSGIQWHQLMQLKSANVDSICSNQLAGQLANVSMASHAFKDGPQLCGQSGWQPVSLWLAAGVAIYSGYNWPWPCGPANLCVLANIQYNGKLASCNQCNLFMAHVAISRRK